MESIIARAGIAYNTLMSMGGKVELIEVERVLDARTVNPKPLQYESKTYLASLGEKSAAGCSMTGAAYNLLASDLF